MLKQSLWALAAALFFSMMAACVKLTNGELTTLEMVFYRSLFGVITIGLFVKRNHLSLKTPHLMGNITRSILGTLSISVWFFTLGQLPFGTNMTLVYTTPLFMSVNFIILALLRHQRAPWGLAAAIIAGFSGITIILQPSFSSDQLWPAFDAFCGAPRFGNLLADEGTRPTAGTLLANCFLLHVLWHLLRTDRRVPP